MLTGEYLKNIRSKDIRKQIWYNYLDDVERAIFSLLMAVRNKITSSLLITILVKIIVKIDKSLKSSFINYLEYFSMARMTKIQNQAKAFGCAEVNLLNFDKKILLYLVLLDYNQPMGWRVHTSLT